MNGLREKIADLVDAISRNEVSEPTDAVLRVLAEHGGVANLREQISLMVWRSANKRAERAEADLAAAQMALRVARRRLDKVRALAEQTRLYPDTLRAILDAPARPAGHDESGQ
jgi:hypothetical protein